MLSLVESLPGTRISIFSGLEPGGVKRALLLAAAEDGVELETAPDAAAHGVGSGGGDGGGGGGGAPRAGLGTVIVAAATASAESAVGS